MNLVTIGTYQTLGAREHVVIASLKKIMIACPRPEIKDQLDSRTRNAPLPPPRNAIVRKP
jgi:hypothetical protein